MARPTKLDSKLIVKICKNILTGATYQAVAEAAGISYDTFNEYRKGAAAAIEKSPSKRTEYDELLIEFSEAVAKANAELEINLMQSIKTKGKRDWKALAWILQNRFPEKYSERKQVNHNVVEWDKADWEKNRKKRLKEVQQLDGE